MRIIGKLLKSSSQRYIVYDKQLECPTLQAAIGTGGNISNKIEFTIVENLLSYVFRLICQVVVIGIW